MKLKDKKKIGNIVHGLKLFDKKIVTTNGTFDLFHLGHLRILEQAREQGDYLIVGLNSDKSVKSYKGKDRPINNEQNRSKMLSSLECVDYIVLFDEPEIAVPLLNLIRPHVHVNGAKYTEDCVEARTVKKIKAKLFLVDELKGFSTSNLIKKIKEM